MNEYNRLCLCDKPGCPWCKVWHQEQESKRDHKADAKTAILRTKFKAKR